jgi:hypothetical protein
VPDAALKTAALHYAVPKNRKYNADPSTPFGRSG